MPCSTCVNIFYAAALGHGTCTLWYLGQGQASLKNSLGQTPLHIATVYGHVACVRRLARAVDVAATDAYMKTALHYAAQHNRRECAEILVRAGAPLDRVDASALTPERVALYKKVQWWPFLSPHDPTTRAATTIQRQFRESILNPGYAMCRNRLLREFNQMDAEISDVFV